MIPVDFQGVIGQFFVICCSPDNGNATGLKITFVDPPYVHALFFQKHLELVEACINNRAIGREMEDALGKWRTIRVQNIVDKCYGTKRPEDKERSSILFRVSTETFTPISRRSGITQAGFLKLQEHCIERSKVSQPRDKIKQSLEVSSCSIKTRVIQ